MNNFRYLLLPWYKHLKHKLLTKCKSKLFHIYRSSASLSIPVVEGPGLLGPKSRKNLNKKTLVLDLDETLVHSSFKPPEQPDIVLPVDIEGKVCYVYVLIRPGAISFLEELSEYYELVIFTASLSKYAEPLMKILDQEEWCS